MKCILVLCLLLWTQLNSAAQSPRKQNPVAVNIPGDLSQWLVLPPPKPGTKAYYAINHSYFAWSVAVKKGQITFAQHHWKAKVSDPLPFNVPVIANKGNFDFYGDRIVRKIDEGWLVGYDGGEWGGGLYWFNPKGTKGEKIIGEQVIHIFPKGNGFLVFTGLAHLMSNVGKVYFVEKKEGQRDPWAITKLAALKGSPDLVLPTNAGDYLIVTSDALQYFTKDGAVNTLIADGFWSGYIPNSVAILPSGEIYIGMKHGITRVTKQGETYTAAWLLPNLEFAKYIDPFDK